MNLVLPPFGIMLNFHSCISHVPLERLRLKDKSGIQILIIKDEPIVSMLIEDC
jgi:hypothetical protein